MAYTRLKERSNGTKFYEIQISRGRGKGSVYKRWNVPDGKSQKTIEKELAKYVADLENQVKADELCTMHERMAKDMALLKERESMPTVAEYSADFLKVKALERSAKTIEFYDYILSKHILPILGTRKLDEVQGKDIKKLITDMQANYSYSTVHGAFVTLNQLFDSAYYDEIIPKNPVSKKHAPKRSKDDITNQADKVLSLQDINRIRECLKAESLKWQCIVNLLIDTGMRRAEVCAIRWCNVDFTNGAILINANIVNARGLDGKYALKEVAPKSGHNRIVYCSDSTLALLTDYATSLGAVDTKGYIFTQSTNQALPITPHAISKFLMNFGRANGFENLHPHMLRHSFATIGILNGVDVVSMSKLLGHADPTITLAVYSHANETANRLASEKTLLALHGNDNNEE